MKPYQISIGKRGYIPDALHQMAYKVYCEVYAPQEALTTGNCRGGFGTGELIAFLYALQFPKEEWRDRVNEVFAIMKHKGENE